MFCPRTLWKDACSDDFSAEAPLTGALSADGPIQTLWGGGGSYMNPDLGTTQDLSITVHACSLIQSCLVNLFINCSHGENFMDKQRKGKRSKWILILRMGIPSLEQDLQDGEPCWCEQQGYWCEQAATSHDKGHPITGHRSVDSVACRLFG